MFHRFGGRHRRHEFARTHGRHGPGHGARGGRGMGMRRPLRFLISRLDLDDDQAAKASKILDDLRLERQQADLDRRRAQAAIADLFAADTLDTAALQQAAEVRVTAATRERDAGVAAVTRLHAALTAEQRLKLSTVLRESPLSL